MLNQFPQFESFRNLMFLGWCTAIGIIVFAAFVIFIVYIFSLLEKAHDKENN